MTFLRLFAALALFCELPVCAQESPEAPAAGQEPAAAQAAGDHGHEAVPTMEMGNGDFFINQFSHLMPHELARPELSSDPGVNELFVFYDVNLFQVITLGLMVVIFGLVLGSFGGGSTPWILRVFRGWCLWIRDEMVYAVMGKEEGRAFAPFFIYLFFFLAVGNLVGLVPGSVTFSATVFVTGALALLTLVMMLGFGMMKQGVVKFWVNLLPHGLPLPLIPLMVVLELVGLLVKPFALMIRLFANMLAGHLVVYAFVGMIFLFAKMMEMGAVAYGTALPTVAMAVFIYIIESFVAILQAYIFTYLSIIFVQQAMHPAH